MKTRQFAIIAGLVLVLLGSAFRAHAWYDPGAQRWINRDPIQEQGGVNLYSFVRNNPVTQADSFGWKTVTVPGGQPCPAGYRYGGEFRFADGSVEIICYKPEPPQPLPPWMQPPKNCPPGDDDPRTCWKDPSPFLKGTVAWQSACELAREACDTCCGIRYGQSGPLQACFANCEAKVGACVQGLPGPVPPRPPPVIFPEHPPRPNVPPRPKPWP